MAKKQLRKLAWFIAEHINDEIIRGNTEVDYWMVLDALEAYEGGAADGYEDQFNNVDAKQLKLGF